MTTAVRLAGQKFKAGQSFQLAMCGNWQPEEGCQSKKQISKTPHAIIDSRWVEMVQTYLSICLMLTILVVAYLPTHVWLKKYPTST